MVRFLLIGLGGAVGTWARYLIALWAARALGTSFPYGTLIVNLAGCFLIAAVMQVALSTSHVPLTLRLTLTTGFLGGMTTYSSFNYETTKLLQERAWGTGLLNFAVTTSGCFAAGLFGLFVARRVLGN
jgi:CrcB protein